MKTAPGTVSSGQTVDEAPAVVNKVCEGDDIDEESGERRLVGEDDMTSMEVLVVGGEM